MDESRNEMMKRGRPPGSGMMKQSALPPIDKVEGQEDTPKPFEVDDAMNTLQKAQELQADPKMMGHVHEATGKKIMGLKTLKALAAKKRAQGL